MSDIVAQQGCAADHVSPLVLGDQLLTLAKDAERAGYTRSARRLIKILYAVYDECDMGH